MTSAKNKNSKLLSLIFIVLLLFFFTASIVSVPSATALDCDQAWYNTWLNWYGQSSPPAPSSVDLNGDGKVNGQDYVIWLVHYDTKNCGNPPAIPTVDSIGTAQATNPDFPDVRAYCRSIGYQDIKVTGSLNNVYSVYCVRNDTEIASFDINTVCTSLYGAGAKAEITDVNSAYGWKCVTNNSVSGSSPTPPVNRPPLIMGSPQPTGTFSVHAIQDYVNVRSGSGTSYPVIGQISMSSGYFDSIGIQNGWVHITFTGGDGWVSLSLIQPADTNPTLTPTMLPTLEPTVVPLVTATLLRTCPSGTGPDGITAGGSTPPQDLTQAQRQWLYEAFGHQGIAPVGYGGEPCTSEAVTLQCPSGVGPGGITAGGYTPQDLTQEQRQWLFEKFGNQGIAPVGYGGQSCINGQAALPPCPSGVGKPGGFDPTTLTQQQRNDLFHAFGNVGEAPVGYGGKACYGGAWTLPSFSTIANPTTLTPPTAPSASTLPIYYGSTKPIGALSAQITALNGLNIRSGAGITFSVIGLAASGGFFEVIGGPVNGWYEIRFDGKIGWVSGDWIELNHLSILITPTTVTEYENITVSLDDWSIVLHYNSSTNEILNGSDFVAWELNRLLERMISHHIPCETTIPECAMFVTDQQFVDAFKYNMELIGEVEIIRHKVESTLCGSNAACQNNLRYVVGSQRMDTSGPGNIIFGYTCAWMGVPALVEYGISDLAQPLSDLKNHLPPTFEDKPDDVNQRRVGRYIYESVGQNSNPAPDVISRAADTIKGLNHS